MISASDPAQLPANGAMYDKIGDGYAESRRPDHEIGSRIAGLVRSAKAGSFLDLGCGTGNYTQLLRAIVGGRWRGLDQSMVMLSEANRRDCDIGWDLGCAEEMPYDRDSFDGVVCINAVHFFDSVRCLAAVKRVLKPGGRLAIFSATAELVSSYWLQRYFPVTVQKTIETMPRTGDLIDQIQACGLRLECVAPFYVTPTTADYFFYSGKQRPALYFDDRVTSNISQFRRFCSAEELDVGRKALDADLKSGMFVNVASAFTASGIGDCRIVSAVKEP